MKAMTYACYGEPDVMQLSDEPMPKVAPGEVLIRVRRAAVNPVDWKLMAGKLDAVMPTFFPVIPGWDVAGTVEAVGFDVPEFAVGDAVLAYARKDYVQGGSYAEFVSVPARSVARKPEALGWDEAGGLPLAGLTAYQLLTRLGIGRGDTVLIHAASGGVGVMGAQIARNLGGRVIGTASKKNHDFLGALGIEPVEYGDGLAERVRELVPEGVDVVGDFIGGVLPVTQAVLREGGRHASIVDDSVQQAGGHYIWVRPSGSDLQVLADMAAEGRLDVPVAERFPLERAAEAMRLNQTGHVRGKVILQVAD